MNIRACSSVCLPAFVRSLPAAIVTCGVYGSAALAQCPNTLVPMPGTTSTVGTSGQVNALAVLNNGDVAVGGAFVVAGGASSTYLAFYTPSTGVWTSTNRPGFAGPNGVVNAMAVTPDGKLLIGGEFTTWYGTAVSHVAIYDPVTHDVQPVGGGVNGPVYAVAVLAGGSYVVGGNFQDAGGFASADNVVELIPGINHCFPIGSGLPGAVYALTVLPNGTIVAGGAFASSSVGSHISRCQGTSGSWSPIGFGSLEGVSQGDVYSITPLGNDELLVGGTFQRVTSFLLYYKLARCNLNTGNWSSCNSSLLSSSQSSVLAALALPPVAGGFGAAVSGTEVMLGGTSLFPAGVARYSRSSNSITYAAPGEVSVNGTVKAMAVLPDGTVVIGGAFSRLTAPFARNIAMLTPGAAAPTVLGQPLSVNTYRSGTALLGVTALPATANDGPLVFQWRHNNVPIDAAVNPSAATAVLTLTNVQQADLGSYNCFITNACGGTGPTSATATVSFVVDPCPADVGVQGGTFGHDGVLDNNDFISFINKFFEGC